MTDSSTFDRPTQRRNDANDAVFPDVLGIGISADRFFMHAQVVGINLAREGVTIAQVREWRICSSRCAARRPAT
jgi:hypothetical protein